MMPLTPKISREIITVTREGDALIMHSAYGTLKISFMREDIARVMFTRADAFAQKDAESLVTEQTIANWTYEEHAEAIILKTAQLTITVNRETAALTYFDEKGRLLLKERTKDCRTLEEFDSYKMVIDENTKIEQFETPDGIKERVVEASRIYDKKLYRTRMNLVFSEDEALYGLGQAEEGTLNLRKTTQYLHQANMKIAVPLLVSTNGYGIMLHTYSPAIFNDTAYGSYLYTEADPEMDFFFIRGERMDDVIDGYRYLTGSASMLPAWAFGFVQSLERYETSEELEEIVAEYRRRKLGIDCVVLDWESWEPKMWGQKSFDPLRFKNPDQMMDNLHEMNAHLMISIWPNMDKKCANFEEFHKAGLLLPASNIYDAYKEEGRNLYWEQVNRGLFSHGIDAWWCDSSEPYTPEWSHKERPEPSVMYQEFYRDAANYMPAEKSNAYGIYHARTMYEGQRKTDASKRMLNLTRNGYLGQQRYGTVLWSGDIYASWDTLKNQIVAGLNFCASGLPYWTIDIGGFFVRPGVQWFWNGDYMEGSQDLGYRELYTRWYQYGAFLPMFRSHGTDTRRELWQYGEPGEMFYDSLVKFNQLRYQLMPYIYSTAGRVWLENATMMRMLAFDFPQDILARECKDQYLFGDSLMICPVTTPMYYEAGSKKIDNAVLTRTVYLPKGTGWYDFWTHQYYEGGQLIEADASIDTMPIFVKEGSIIPLAPVSEYVGQEVEENTTLLVFTGKDAVFTLYEDAGDGYEYENGEYAVTTISWNQGTQNLEVGDARGQYRTTAPSYTIVKIEKE